MARATTRAEPKARRKPVRKKPLAPPPGEGISELVQRLKRDRIVSAAVDLFYTQGYGKTTLDEVAQALGVTKPFIYQFFASKNELLAEVCSRAIRNAHDVLNRTLTQEGTATQKLRTIVREFLMSVLENQAHAVVYSREETELLPEDRALIMKLRREFDDRLVALLKEGNERKEFTVADPRLTAIAIGSVVGWAPVWFRPGGRLSREQASDDLANLVLQMVCARPVPPR